MIVAAAVDDRYGMLFNKRRQSKDVKLREHLMAYCEGKELRMNEYSMKQFTEISDRNLKLYIGDDFLEGAGKESICFVENVSVLAHADKIEKVLLYKWNRTYPGDFYFDFPLTEHGFHCTVIEEFAGNSHEKITVEEWIR